jgi:hypothetical protein
MAFRFFLKNTEGPLFFRFTENFIHEKNIFIICISI